MAGGDPHTSPPLPLAEVKAGEAKKAPRTRAKPQLPDVKDKGYAWLIVLVMFLSNVSIAGYIKSFGIIYNALKVAYPDTSETEGGTMIALLSGFRSVLAPVVGAAAVQFGCRLVMMCGVSLCASALFISYFCNSIGLLTLTLGAMMGIGMCTVETCQIIVLAEYFNKKKELANSLRVSGNPLGGAVFPFLLVLVFEYYGLQLSFIIMSSLLVQLMAFIFLIRPYKVHQRIMYAELSKADASKAEADTPATPAAPQEKAKKFDVRLFVNPLYWTHLAMIVGLSACLPHAQIFVAVYGRSVQLSGAQISALLAYQAVLDTVTRLIIGAFLNKKMFKKTHCFTVCLVIGGIGTALIPTVHNFWLVLAFFTLFSVGSSGFFSTVNVILLDQFGACNASSSWGFIRMVQGLLNFLYPPILGYMVDATGAFYLTFLTMGCGMAFAGLCIALQPLVARLAKQDIVFL